MNGTCRYWNMMRAPELRELAATAVAIWPIASTEQHGPHLATGTDTHLNDGLQAHLVAEPPARGEYVILPTLPLGASDHHTPFGGTLSLPAVLYTDVLATGIRCLLGQGWKRILMINSHGGNTAPMTTALAEVALDATDAGALVGGLTYFAAVKDAWERDIPELVTARMGHACQLETSMMLTLLPETIAMDERRDDPFQAPINQAFGVALPFSEFTTEGAIGYPEKATTAIGQRLYEVAAREMRRILVEFLALAEVRQSGTS